MFGVVRAERHKGTFVSSLLRCRLETAIRDGTDRHCAALHPELRRRAGLDEERAISGFLHAARLGLFCPGCGGVLDATQTLKSVHKEAYDCALCACGYEPTLDEMVESPLRLARACAGSRRTIRIRCRSQIFAAYSGALGSTCLRLD